MWREWVKGKLEMAVCGEANDIGTQAQVEAQIPEVTVVLCCVEGL